MSKSARPHVEVRRNRPPTAVYPDRGEIARYRQEQYPPTAARSLRLYVLNIEGGFFSPGALKDLIVPLAQEIRNGEHGVVILMVATSDDATVDFLELVASHYGLSFFILPSPTAPLGQARPVGRLTPAEAGALELLRQTGGESTSAMVAHAAGIEVNAAVNRLRGVAEKGYVYRVPRPRREGDLFFDPRVVADEDETGPEIESVERDRIELDSCAAAEWDALNARPARDLPGLRRLMERPSPFAE